MPHRRTEWPEPIVEAIVRHAPEEARSACRSWLSDQHASTRDGFIRVFATADDGLDLHVSQCEDDPQEIVLRASGSLGCDEQGHTRSCKDYTLLLLAPWWSENGAYFSQILCQAVINAWQSTPDELRSAARDHLDATSGQQKAVSYDPDGFVFDLVYRDGEHLIVERTTDRLVDRAGSGGAALQLLDRYSSDRGRKQVAARFIEQDIEREIEMDTRNAAPGCVL